NHKGKISINEQLDNRALCMPDNPCPDADPAGQPAPPVNGDGLGGANVRNSARHY
ncbi:hypothetical protein Tsp_11310, partial [Trichinella spiralis]|uniref:hypothetical protein n=1 Tax=Trichinella spiralis TaxID=6334 RepID=UPI0001EFEF1C